MLFVLLNKERVSHKIMKLWCGLLFFAIHSY